MKGNHIISGWIKEIELFTGKKKTFKLSWKSQFIKQTLTSYVPWHGHGRQTSRLLPKLLLVTIFYGSNRKQTKTINTVILNKQQNVSYFFILTVYWGHIVSTLVFQYGAENTRNFSHSFTYTKNHRDHYTHFRLSVDMY